ncbi:MAG: alkaline phosphatase family protein [Bacteroidia bacterium]|nr:alkaline phosphatase family protein [Bacteroidia bacterium]MBP7245339.1 alkaline phosphatase family protein [Bacteroidia bacterium]
MRNFIIALFIALPHFLSAQSNSNRPQLVVGVVVDQMRPDFISRYWDKFGNGGFKRLINEGFNCKNTQYNYAPTHTGPGHASIYTGTTPSYHGITGNDWFDLVAMDTVNCVSDSKVTSVGTTSTEGNCSPSRLLTTTITDQLRVATHMKAKVISVSLKNRGAILPGGRSGQAYWFDGLTGKFITSSWYRNDLPTWLIEFNDRRWADEYLSKPWNTVFPIKQYTESDPDDNAYEAPFTGEEKPIFPHDLPSLRGTRYDIITDIPFGNTMTKDVALAAILGEKLGDDSITDFLAISFSAVDHIGHQFGIESVEMEDAYIRLDRDLSDLLTFLDNRVGKNKYLFFLTADHGAPSNPIRSKDLKLNTGIISTRNIQDTARYFLKMNYGKAEYFRCRIKEQVYLDEDLIAKDKLSLCEMSFELGNYLKKTITGLGETLTSCEMESNVYSDMLKSRIQNGHYHGRGGDVYLLYLPGWTEPIAGVNRNQGTNHGSPYSYDAQVPLHWFGWNIPNGSTHQAVNITDIVPTLSFLLNVPLPYSANGKKIDSLVK